VKFKSTYALLIIFVGLGAYLYFTEYRGREERQRIEETKKRIFSINHEDIVELRLEYPERTIAAVRKPDAGWEMTLPPGMEADSQEWDSLATSFTGIEKEETVNAGGADLAPFGLDMPAVKVTARVQGENSREITVLFGSENPKKTFRYAKVADNPEIFLAANTWSTTFTKSVADLRNKTILDFDAENVDRVRITAAGRPEIELQKSGTDWLLKKPVEAAADSSEVSSFVSSIQFVRASDFADPSIGTAKAGLERPGVRITLHDQQAGVDRVLLVGGATGTDMYYAKDQARPVIFVMSKDIVEKARRPVFDWRDKTVARFNRDAVDEIEIVRSQQRIIARKKDDQWTLADGRLLQGGRISEMLSNVEFERALGMVDQAAPSHGVSPGRIRVIFREAGKEVMDLTFGRDSTTPEGVYAKTAASPAVFVVSRTLYDTFDVAEGDLIETPPPANPAPK
jgi:hypothetical protein